MALHPVAGGHGLCWLVLPACRGGAEHRGLRVALGGFSWAVWTLQGGDRYKASCRGVS